MAKSEHSEPADAAPVTHRSKDAASLSPDKTEAFTRGRLWLALQQSQDFGFFGPGPLETPYLHARGFLDAASDFAADCGEEPLSASWLDLGSGGGLPGLVGIDHMPQTKWVLLDAQAKRVRFLQSVIAAWNEDHRVECVLGRAEELYRARKTGVVDIVVARGFGPPSVTAECASPLLAGVQRRRDFGFALLHKQEDHHRDIPRPTATLVRKLLF
jgi:hypothetical protein